MRARPMSLKVLNIALAKTPKFAVVWTLERHRTRPDEVAPQFVVFEASDVVLNCLEASLVPGFVHEQLAYRLLDHEFRAQLGTQPFHL